MAPVDVDRAGRVLAVADRPDEDIDGPTVLVDLDAPADLVVGCHVGTLELRDLLVGAIALALEDVGNADLSKRPTWCADDDMVAVDGHAGAERVGLRAIAGDNLGEVVRSVRLALEDVGRAAVEALVVITWRAKDAVGVFVGDAEAKGVALGGVAGHERERPLEVAPIGQEPGARVDTTGRTGGRALLAIAGISPLAGTRWRAADVVLALRVDVATAVVGLALVDVDTSALGTCLALGADAAVLFVGLCTLADLGITTVDGADVAVVTNQRRPTRQTDATLAAIAQRAGVAVVALADVVDRHAALGLVAAVGRARVGVVANQRHALLADAALAAITHGAGVPVVTRAFGARRVAGTLAGDALISAGTRVAVIAREPLVEVRYLALAIVAVARLANAGPGRARLALDDRRRVDLAGRDRARLVTVQRAVAGVAILEDRAVDVLLAHAEVLR